VSAAPGGQAACCEYGNIVWAVNNTVSLQKLFLTQKKSHQDNYQFSMACSSGVENQWNFELEIFFGFLVFVFMVFLFF